MTRNLKIYALFSILWSVIFFTVLNWGIADAQQRWPFIWIAAFTYGIGFSLVGKWLGERDITKKRINLRGVYYFTSFSISGVIGAVWLAAFHPSELWQLLVYSVVASSIVSYVFYKYRDAIKGMKNEELFK